MPNSTYEQDLRHSAEFSLFLDNNLYRPLEKIIQYPNDEKLSIYRIYEKEIRFQGIDVVFKEGKTETYIDEKCQLHYPGDDLQTFALELSYINRAGVTEPGWLLDTQRVTNAYLFCWPLHTAGQREFMQARALLVFRHHILAALDNFGFSIDALAERDTAIRKNYKHGRYRSHCNDFWFFYSMQYPEQPINIVMRTAMLQSLSVADITIHVDQNTLTSHGEGMWAFHPISW